MRAVFVLILSSAFLAGCILEEVKSSHSEKLIIVSDYLEARDSLLFSEFTKKTGIRTEIRNMTTDQLIGTIRKNKYDSGIDLILMRSLYDVNRLNKIGAYHRISPPNTSKFNLPDYNVCAIGIDPYIILAKSDTLFRADIHYRDLNAFTGLNMLDHEEYITFLGNWYSNEDPIVANGYVHQFNSKVYRSNNTISTDTIDYLLSSKYHWKRTSTDSTYREFRVHYQPSGQHEGLFYNIATIGILNQANDYLSANRLIAFTVEGVHNVKIANQLNILSLSEADIDNYPSIRNNLQYYTNVERTINR